MGVPAYEHGWLVSPPTSDGVAQWPETPGDYSTTYESSHYLTDSAASYTDLSSVSPRTTWSYDGYGRRSPSERHYQYPPGPEHHRYSSISSTASLGDRRMGMADSIANAFLDPDTSLSLMNCHRPSQPQIHNTIGPSHSETWITERSASFAEAPYPPQEYTPSPPLAHASEHQRSLSAGSINGLGKLSQYNLQPETELVATW